MIDVVKAIKIIARETGTVGSERVDLADSVGRVLREDIVADTDLPPFDRSQVDGYAVIAADTRNAPATLKIAGESAAGRGWHKTMKGGEAVRIMTGAPLPKGADAVQKIELTHETEGCLVHIDERTAKGRYIVHKGSEIKKGRTVFNVGEIVTGNMIAAACCVWLCKSKSFKKTARCDPRNRKRDRRDHKKARTRSDTQFEFGDAGCTGSKVRFGNNGLSSI